MLLCMLLRCCDDYLRSDAAAQSTYSISGERPATCQAKQASDALVVHQLYMQCFNSLKVPAPKEHPFNDIHGLHSYLHVYVSGVLPASARRIQVDEKGNGRRKRKEQNKGLASFPRPWSSST